MTTPASPKSPNKLAVALGMITCVLAWTAALIRFMKDGEVQWSLLAAGVLFAVLPLMASKPKPPSPPK